MKIKNEIFKLKYTNQKALIIKKSNRFVHCEYSKGNETYWGK